MTIKIGERKFYLVEDLAKLLFLTPVTVRVYIKQNKIKGKKTGRRWIVSETDLLNYLEGEES